MKIFIINLKRSPDRKTKMITQLEKLSNSKYEKFFFEAIDAKENQHLSFMQHFSYFTKYIKGRHLTDGEFACYTSHYCLWKKCIELNEPIIILEDDVGILTHFDEVTDKIINSGYHYVKLASTFNKKQFEIEPNFFSTNIESCGALGYYLTPVAAKLLLEKSKKFYKPVDDFMDSFWIHKVRTIIYNPNAIYHNDNDTTTISDRKIKIPIRLKIIRELGRGLLYVRKYFYLMINWRNEKNII